MANSLMQSVRELLVIYRDPPGAEPEAEFRSHVAVAILDGLPGRLSGFEYFEVSGGEFAVLRHTGPYPTLKAACNWLHEHWLPNSRLEPRDAPPLEVYINDPRTTPAADLRTDIRLPLM